MADHFAGGVAVVTGGGGGLGAGLARHAALERRMKVVLVDVDANALELTRADIEKQGGSAAVAVVDVRDPAALKLLASRVDTEFGAVRLLINNAGVEQFSYIWDTPESNWDRLVAVNVSGVFYGLRAFMPKMLSRREPCWIWNVGSAASVCAAPLQGAYIMSKHAVLALTECLYQEVRFAGADHVHVSAILPGGIQSRIFETAGGADAAGDAQTARLVLDASLRSRANVLTPDAAAARIFQQGIDAQFYIVTDDEVLGYMKDRADFLSNRRAPRLFDRAMLSSPTGFIEK